MPAAVSTAVTAMDVIRRRLFFALWPETAVREQLSAMRDAIKPGTQARPIQSANLHITLAFLGDMTQRQTQQAQCVAAIVNAQSFDLILDHYGHFARPRVLFAAATVIPAAALDLHHQLKHALIDHQLPVEQRPWAPHVSLYRKVRQAPQLIQPAVVSWPVRHFALIESVFDPAGVQYRELQRWPLQAAAN